MELKAKLIGGETYDKPPGLQRGVMFKYGGLVHVVHRNNGIRVQTYCTTEWMMWQHIERGWFEHPTCFGCVMSRAATYARYSDLEWRELWHIRNPSGEIDVPV